MEYQIGSEESLSHAVLTSVSMLEDTATTDLPVLYKTVDPNALDAIFAGDGNICISFGFSNSLIEVYNGEYLTVESA
ncbi:HalOD1 output domain-containing protein (plasmid) [Haloarcula marismortui]|uniref:HalOD1 output domain-containing protein n=1 Tax=Haloarcula marismortui TaxID=2238 RepID=UPI000679627F